MSWSEGFFSFEDRPRGEMPSDSRVSVSTESLLMEGARRIDEWSRIADIIPNVEVIAELAPVRGGSRRRDARPAAARVAGPDDDRRRRAISAASPTRCRATNSTSRRIAYGLATTGVITVRPPSRIDERSRSGAESLLASARALTRAGRHADAFGELRRAVQEDPLTPRVHLDFGCAAARIGDFALARASWEHVLRLTPDDAVGLRARDALDALNHLHRVLEAHVDD